MWQFEAYRDNGGYSWRLKAANGQPVATSRDALSSEMNARHSAAHFKAIAASWLYEIYAEGRDRYRWRAKAANGRVVAISHDLFRSHGDAQRAANNVKVHAHQATGV